MHEPSQSGSTLDGLRSNCTPRYLMLFFHSILCSPRTIFGHWKDFDVVSGANDKCVIHEADDARSSKYIHAQEIVIHDVPNEWTHLRPLRGATCHLFFERPLVAIVYHPPVAQIVIYHSQQVVWNLIPHHRLDADVPARGIERCEAFSTQDRQLVAPPVHRVPGTSMPTARH